MYKVIYIQKPFITLTQLLKITDVVSSGGEAKIFLQEVAIKVNQELEARRGKKLYPNDEIEIAGHGVFRVLQEEG